MQKNVSIAAFAFDKANVRRRDRKGASFKST